MKTDTEILPGYPIEAYLEREDGADWNADTRTSYQNRNFFDCCCHCEADYRRRGPLPPQERGMNMKRTANKFQRAYMVAKARVQEVESQQEAIEKKFIADKGIVNPDGSVPEFLYCMEDDAAFEKANDECAALIVSAGLEEELNAARSVLKASEDSLIAYGLSLAPAGVRATLEKAVQHNAATRAKVLDLAFRLDVSTVSA